MVKDAPTPYDVTRDHIALVGSASTAKDLEETKKTLNSSLRNCPVIMISIEDAVLHRKLSGVGIIILHLSPEDILSPFCGRLLRWAEKTIPCCILPIWCAQRNEIPQDWKTVTTIVKSSLTKEQFTQRLLNEIQKVIGHQEDNSSCRDAFSTKKSIPAIEVGGAPRILTINQNTLLNFGLVLIYGTIFFFIAHQMELNHFFFSNSQTYEDNYSVQWIMFSILTFIGIQLLIQLKKCLFPNIGCIITPEYFYFKASKKLYSQWKWKGDWRRIPIGSISHFSTYPLDKIGSWKCGLIIVHFFSPSKNRDYYNSETIKLPFFLDEHLITQLLNGQLHQYRPYVNPFYVQSNFKLSRSALHRTLAISSNLKILLVWGWKYVMNEASDIFGGIKKNFVSLLNSSWKNNIWKIPLFVVSLALTILYLLITSVFVILVVLAFKLLAAWLGIFYDFLITLFTQPSLLQSLFLIIMFTLILVAWGRSRWVPRHRRIAKNIGISWSPGTSPIPSLQLSYSHQDQITVDLAEALRSNGITVWIDRFCILPGENWIEKFKGGISENEILGIVLSKESVKAYWVREELKWALKTKGAYIKILPILIDDVPIPDFLLQYGYVDMRKKENYFDCFNEILFFLQKSAKNTYNKEIAIKKTSNQNGDNKKIYDQINSRLNTNTKVPKEQSELWEYQQQHYLEPLGNKLYQSPWWLFTKLEISFGIVVLLGWIKTILFWPSETVNSAAPLMEVIPHSYNLGFLFQYIWIIHCLILIPMAIRIVNPKPWAILNDTKLKIHNGKLIDLKEIWKISRDRHWMVFHYFPRTLFDQQPRVLRVNALKCIGQLRELEMTLKGMLFMSKEMADNHISMGESTLLDPPILSFLQKLIRLLYNLKDPQEVKELPDHKPAWKIFPIWGFLTLVALFLFHPDIEPHLYEAGCIFFWALLFFIGLRIIVALFDFIKVFLPLVGMLGVVILMIASIWFGSFEKAERWVGNLTNFKSCNSTQKKTVTYYKHIDDFFKENPLAAPSPRIDRLIATTSPKIKSGVINFDQPSPFVTFTVTNQPSTNVDRRTGVGQIVSAFGRPSFLRHAPHEQKLILFYIHLGIKFHMTQNRVEKLTIIPSGEIMANPFEKNDHDSLILKTLIWDNPATWSIGKTLIDFSTIKNTLKQLLSNRHLLPPLYMLPEPGIISLSPCRHPVYKECSMIVFKKTASKKQVIIEIVF